MQSVPAQIFVSSSSQQLIEQAVQEGIVLLRQEYQLEDTITRKRYTWDNRPEFGSATSLCVLTETGYVVADDVLAPWRNDDRYRQFQDSIFRPVLSKTFCRSIRDSVWRAVPGTIAPQKSRPLCVSSWLQVDDTLFQSSGFTIDFSAGEKEGWLVWLTSDKEKKFDSSALSLLIYRHKLTMEDGTDCCEIPAAATPRRIIGGIYIEPQCLKIGKVTFALSGVVVGKDDKWKLLRLIPNIPIESDDTGALTPVERESISDRGSESEIQDKIPFDKKKKK